MMNDDQFTKLFKYIEEFRSEVNTKLDKKASQSSMEHLINTIDGFVKRIDDNEIEQASRDLQFERLLEWARKVSEKTGIPLKDL
jgi:flagellar biosynthesis chaperone FliJ